MILLTATFGFLFSCSKEMIETKNYLPGTWNLMQTELYENGVLKASDMKNEVTVIYHFSSCETGNGNSCDMYIEEDGEQQFYSYTYDEITRIIQLNGSSNFLVEEMSAKELKLAREYDGYKSTYHFTRGD